MSERGSGEDTVQYTVSATYSTAERIAAVQ